MITNRCRDFLHHRCADCSCRCHADERVFADTATYGQDHAVPALYSRDLLAHLQSGRLDLEQAAQAVRTVVDLGWRPTVAILVREQALTPPPVAAPAEPAVAVADVDVQGVLL